MSVALRFQEHEGFQRTALQMALAGGGAGLLAWGLFRPAWTLGSVALVAVAAALGTIGREPWSKIWEPVLRGGLALAGAGCLALFGGAEGALGFACFFGAAVSLGLHGRRLLFAVGASAAVTALALWTQTQVVFSQELASLPGWSVSTLAGVAFSMVAVVALLPRHLELRRDVVTAAYREVADKSTGEVRELCVRAHGVWSRAAAELPDDDDSRRLLSEAVLRLFGTAERWSGIDAGSSQSRESLIERMAALDERIAAAKDDVVRTQYESAQAALAEQLRYLEDIGTHRERVLARMHNYLAVIERLHLAVVKLESADASREGLEPIVSDLEELGQDMESSTAALDAADRATVVQPPGVC